jgi:hypothetical protein
MMTRLRPVGPRGLALLAMAGVVGIVLAAHGWAHRATGGALGSLEGPSTPAQLRPAATPHADTGSTAGPTAPAGGAGQASAPGPLLTSQPFAPYAFAIWPGTPGTAAKAALTGLSVSIRRVPSGLSITAAVNGQPAGPAHVYPHGARVYVLEAAMGDDSGSSDYNLSDDGLVVTDSRGRIIS